MNRNVSSFGSVPSIPFSQPSFGLSRVTESRSDKLKRVLTKIQLNGRYLTNSEIDQLLNIKTFDGSFAYTGTGYLSNSFVAEAAYYCAVLPFNEALRQLTSKYAQDSDISMLNPSLEGYFNRVILLNAAENVENAVEGIGICRECGHNKIKMVSAATRAIDEETTIIKTCGACGSKNIKEYSLNAT